MVYLDEYDRKARLIPGLLATLPVAIPVVALGLKAQPAIASLRDCSQPLAAPSS